MPDCRNRFPHPLFAQLAERLKPGQFAQPLPRRHQIGIAQPLATIVAILPRLPAIDEIQPWPFDVLHAHDAVEQARRGFPDDPVDDLLAAGVRVADHHQLAAEPAPQLIVKGGN